MPCADLGFGLHDDKLRRPIWGLCSQATSYTLTLDSDAITTAGYTSLRSLTDVQTNTILRINKRSGAVTLQPCTVALNEADQMQADQIMTVQASISGNNRQTKYAS